VFPNHRTELNVDLRNRTVLVTGAGGFIGSHLVEQLVGKGCKVRAFVRYNSRNHWGWLEGSPALATKQVEIFTGDIRDPFSVRESVKGCEVIFHLGALIAIPYSYQAPDAYVDVNVKGTLNIVHAARDFGIKKVVHTSTSEVYGTAQFVPITEDHPLQGQSPYSASKIGADQIAMSFYTSFGTPIAVARPFNTYGPRQSLRAIIPTIISQIRAGQRRLKLGALTPTRDFNFVNDTARGMIAVAESDKSTGHVVNLGSNFEISIGDTVQTIIEAMNVDATVELDQARIRPEKSEVERLWADNRKARDLLGWMPEYGGIDGFRRGIQETIAWFQGDNLRHYKTDLYNI
jgi:dTDP-glucose 4,6-dehydratase